MAATDIARVEVPLDEPGYRTPWLAELPELD
jgi:hypothetical protein